MRTYFECSSSLLLNHVLSLETCLGHMYSLAVFPGSLYPLRQA